MNTPTTETPRVSGRWLVAAIVVFSAVMVTVCAIWLFSRPKSAPAPPPSIALLIVDSTPNQAGNAIASEITAELARIPGYSVAPRSEVESRKSEEDAARIGRELNVRHVLECGLTPEGDRVKVIARLLVSSDGYELWTKTFEPPAGDVAGVAPQIAHDVEAVLELKPAQP